MTRPATTALRRNGIVLVGEDFLAGRTGALVLGDAILHENDAAVLPVRANRQSHAATLTADAVRYPERCGVVDFDSVSRAISREEMPDHPKSRHALTGLCFPDGRAAESARKLLPSARDASEITDLICMYTEQVRVDAQTMGGGSARLYTGTHKAMMDADERLDTIEDRRGSKVAAPEQLARGRGAIDEADLERLAPAFAKPGYGQCPLRRLCEKAPVV